MKTLKHGKVEQRKFTCPKCGCVFVADSNDIKTIREGFNEWRNICFCPTCGENLVWEDGEPYEEPVKVEPDKKWVERLIFDELSGKRGRSPLLTDYLLQNSVTFKED